MILFTKFLKLLIGFITCSLCFKENFSYEIKLVNVVSIFIWLRIYLRMSGKNFLVFLFFFFKLKNVIDVIEKKMVDENYSFLM